MKKIPENKQESEGAERRQGASLLLADAVLLALGVRINAAHSVEKYTRFLHPQSRVGRATHMRRHSGWKGCKNSETKNNKAACLENTLLCCYTPHTVTAKPPT